MKTKSIVENEKKGGLGLIKGALFAVFASLVLILLFAFIIKITNMNDNFIKPINQAIKIISIFIGVGFALKNNKESAFLKGLAIGLIYIIVSFILFSILNNSFKIEVSILNDLFFGALTGALSGMLFKIKR